MFFPLMSSIVEQRECDTVSLFPLLLSAVRLTTIELRGGALGWRSEVSGGAGMYCRSPLQRLFLNWRSALSVLSRSRTFDEMLFLSVSHITAGAAVVCYEGSAVASTGSAEHAFMMFPNI